MMSLCNPCRVTTLLAGVLLLIALTFSPAPTAPAAPADPCTDNPLPAVSPQLQRKLDRFMTDTLKESQAPGMILGIWMPDRGEYVSAKGQADVATHTPMQTTDTFRIGSLTKTFTATVVLHLVDEGKLRLDDPISKYSLPAVATSHIPAIPDGDKITILMLLSHASGLYNYTENAAIEKQVMSRRASMTPQALVEAAIKEKPYFAPGEGYHYSNTDTIILGMLVEQLTGKPLAEEIDRRIIQPLHLTQTTFSTTSVNIPGHFSHGYLREMAGGPLVDWTVQNVSWGWAAGAMTSNLCDLRTFITSVTSGGLLSPDLQHQRMTYWNAHATEPQLPTLKYGMNVFTLGGFIGHNGGLPGFVSMAMRNPESGATIIFMLNAQTPTGDTVQILARLLRLLYPGIKL